MVGRAEWAFRVRNLVPTTMKEEIYKMGTWEQNIELIRSSTLSCPHNFSPYKLSRDFGRCVRATRKYCIGPFGNGPGLFPGPKKMGLPGPEWYVGDIGRGGGDGGGKSITCWASQSWRFSLFVRFELYGVWGRGEAGTWQPHVGSGQSNSVCQQRRAIRFICLNQYCLLGFIYIL